MDDAAAQKDRSSKVLWLVYGIFFFFSLIFLLAGSIPMLLNFSGFQARFTGVKTTGLATATELCGSRGGAYYMYTFTDNHGEVHHITDGICSSGIVSDGERVTIWYQPSNPTQFITANDFTFASIFLAGFSIPMFLFVVVCLVSLFRQLFVSRRRDRRSDLYG